MAFKPSWVQATHDIGKETLHPSIVQVLNYVEDSGAADCGHMYDYVSPITLQGSSANAVAMHRETLGKLTGAYDETPVLFERKNLFIQFRHQSSIQRALLRRRAIVGGRAT